MSRARHAVPRASSCATARAPSQGRAFRDADVLAGRFERGDLVRVAGRVERFRDELQVELRAIGRAPARRGRPGRVPAGRLPRPRRARRLPRAPRRARSTTPACAALLAALLGDEALRAQWRRAPCTRGGHHAYLGGLLEHTVAVGDARAWRPACCTRGWTPTCCMTAALVHDLGKTREFTYGAEIGADRRGPPARPRRARPARCCASAPRDRRRSTTAGCSRSRTACCATTAPTPAPGPALRLGRGARAVPAQRARRRRQGARSSTAPVRTRRAERGAVASACGRTSCSATNRISSAAKPTSSARSGTALASTDADAPRPPTASAAERQPPCAGRRCRGRAGGRRRRARPG